MILCNSVSRNSGALQMDQAESENQILHRNQQERGPDADLDRAMRLSAIGFSQVPVDARKKYATDLAIVAAQSV